MTYSQLYRQTVVRLREAGIEDGHADAAQLFEFCFCMSRTRLVLEGEQEVPEPEQERFEQILGRRLLREPLHYITGTREFWSLDFIVTPKVLIPRPETEFVLETVLNRVKKTGFNHGAVLDMCTGSGVMAVILARELSAGQVVAVDSSFAALQVAARNCEKFGLSESISLICSDLFSALKPARPYEVIVANPPYIAENIYRDLQPEVRDWEPVSALTAGSRGMDVIEKLAREAWLYMRPGGWLFIEIGADQEEDVKELFGSDFSGRYDKVEVLPDWAGRARVLQAMRELS